MEAKVIKACDLWRGKVFDSPQNARVYWPKGISPALQSDRGGGGREIKLMTITDGKETAPEIPAGPHEPRGGL